MRAAAEKLNGDGMAGITLATKAGDGFTAETFEHVALAQGCQLVDDGGKVTFDSPPCVEALRWYGDIASNYSVKGAQDVDSTRGTYFAGQAAMMFWSPFLLDGMAGLRDDTKPSCKECKDDPAFLAENSGLVGPLAGAAGTPSQFGVVSTVNICVDAPDRGRAEARRVHAHRRLRALARALAAGQVPRARRRQLGPEEVPDGVGGAGERRGPQGAAEPVLRRGVGRLARPTASRTSSAGASPRARAR